MNQLQIYKNELFEIGAKVEDETILFDVERVAKCLGITQQKNGNEYVRWERVNEYLPKHSPEVGKGDLIPEPMVYKLAFKASNEVAEQFQDWLAIKVIPQIRRTGTFLSPEQQLRKQLELSLMTSERVDRVEQKMQILVDTMRIDGRQEHALKEQGKAKVFEILGGYGSPAYEKLSRKVFSGLWGDFKRHFLLPRSMDLAKKDFDEAVEFISTWRPDTTLMMEINKCNRQGQLKLVQ